MLGPFPEPQKALHSGPDEIRSALTLIKRPVDAFKGARRKAGGRLLVVDLGAAPASVCVHTPIIDDITNCYKPNISRYHLLTG